MQTTKTLLKNLSRSELEDYVTQNGLEPYRARQIFHWLYQKNAAAPGEMTSLGKPMREWLATAAQIDTLILSQAMHSKYEPTTKFLFEMHDNRLIETVFMVADKRRTICVSSQVGCALQCRFCATGLMGYIRNLSVGEIVDQVLLAQRLRGEKATNIVMMGMGEPFLNYDAVIKAAKLMSDPDGMAISRRKITISTSGVIPAILRFADEGQRFKLAISLNASDEETRRKLMPITKKYSLRKLLDAVKYYSQKSGERVTFEYILLKDVNDSHEDVMRLRALLSGIPCKINLIPYNAIDCGFEPSAEETIDHFVSELASFPAPVTVRRSKGRDIKAACGQLYVEATKKSV